MSVPFSNFRVVVVFTKKGCLGSQSRLVGCQASRSSFCSSRQSPYSCSLVRGRVVR